MKASDWSVRSMRTLDWPTPAYYPDKHHMTSSLPHTLHLVTTMKQVWHLIKSFPTLSSPHSFTRYDSSLCVQAEQRNKFIVYSGERAAVGVALGWGYLWIENINDRKDKIGQSLGIQDTDCHVASSVLSADWYRIRISPAPVIIAALHYGTWAETIWDWCTLRTQPAVSGGKVSPSSY